LHQTQFFRILSQVYPGVTALIKPRHNPAPGLGKKTGVPYAIAEKS